MSSDFYGRLKIGISLVVLIVIPLILASRPPSDFDVIRIAVYFQPAAPNQIELDRIRERFLGRRLYFPFFNDLQIWEIPTSALTKVQGAVDTVGAWIDPVPVDRWFTPPEVSDIVSHPASVLVNLPASRTRFAYLVGRSIDKYFDVDFPLTLDVLPDSAGLRYQTLNGQWHRAVVQSVTLLSPHSYMYSVVSLENGTPAEIHADGRGETGGLDDGSRIISLTAIGNSRSFETVELPQSRLDHPTEFASGAPPLALSSTENATADEGHEAHICQPEYDTKGLRRISVLVAYTRDAWKLYMNKADDATRKKIANESTRQEAFNSLAGKIVGELNAIYGVINYDDDRQGQGQLQFNSVGDAVAVPWDWDSSEGRKVHPEILGGDTFVKWLVPQLSTPDSQGSSEEPLRDLMTRIRRESNAAIVVLLVGPVIGGYNGFAAGIRASYGLSYAVMRADAANLNLTAAHEIGHLLGARHQLYYSCAATRKCLDPPSLDPAHCSCDQSENQYDLRDIRDLVPSPVSGLPVNRAYVGKQDSTGHLHGTVTSHFSEADLYNSRTSFIRLPYVSQLIQHSDDQQPLGDPQHHEIETLKDFAPCVAAYGNHPPTVDNVSTPGLSAATLDEKPDTAIHGSPIENVVGKDDPRLHPTEWDTCSNVEDCPQPIHELEYSTYFNYASSVLQCAERARISKVVKEGVREGERKVYVQGFADASPPKNRASNPEYFNKTLSERRARAVVEEIFTDAGANLTVCYAGQGKHLLRNPTDDGVKSWKNRRAEISWSLRCPNNFPQLCKDVLDHCVTSNSSEGASLRADVEKTLTSYVHGCDDSVDEAQ